MQPTGIEPVSIALQATAITTSAKVALFYQMIELWYCSAVWLSQSIRQGQVLRICVEQSSLPQQTGGWSPRSITICLCTRLRRLARLASLSSNTWISVIRTFWADVTDSIRSYEFHRLGCFHYTKRCINYCTLSRNHCQYCSVVICFLVWRDIQDSNLCADFSTTV